MNNEKLNTLVLRYQAQPTDELFNEIYAAATASWTRTLRKVARSIQASEHELTEVYEDCLLKCVARYDGNSDFSHFYASCCARARTDLYRRKQRQQRREYYEGSEDCEILLNRGNGYNLEEDALRMTKADQRQLIDSLFDPLRVDEVTAIIVANFAKHETLTSLGKAVGVSRRTIKRKLETLASNFDNKQYGDYHDYLIAQ